VLATMWTVASATPTPAAVAKSVRRLMCLG
jgi:hypothetical protein